MKPYLATFALIGFSAISGCTSISGMDAKSEFACKAPDGILCSSMSGIYANAQAKNLPGQRVNMRNGTLPDAPQPKLGAMTQPIDSGTPIRSAPKVLRLWLAPWEDMDGDLHDQSYVYLPVDSGRWLIEHNRNRIRDEFRPVKPPEAVSGPTPTTQAPKPPPGSMLAPNGQANVGVRQDRPSLDQALDLIKGVALPTDVVPGKIE